MEEKILIDCIGNDEKLHRCEPHESVTICGVPVKNKKPTQKDISERYSCYECTF